MRTVHIFPVCIILTSISGAYAQTGPQVCDGVWDKARSYADADSRASREYVYAKQMCSQKGTARTDAENQSLGATYAGYGLSFGSGSSSASQYEEKACEYINNSEKSQFINIKKLNQLSSDAGQSYRACLSLFDHGVKTAVQLSDATASQVYIGVSLSSGQTNIKGIKTLNFSCDVEPSKSGQSALSVRRATFPIVVGGGINDALNISCERTGNTRDPRTGATYWPQASIGLQLAGSPVAFPFSAVTELAAADVKSINSRIDTVQKQLADIDVRLKATDGNLLKLKTQSDSRFPARLAEFELHADTDTWPAAGFVDRQLS